MAPSPASKPLLRAASNASSIASAPSAAHASTTSFALFAVLMLAQIGTSCDNGAMSVAVTSLMAELGASLADVQIANTVYDLVAGAFMLVGGMLGILIGWRRNLRIGLLFALCGEMCATLAPNMAVLTWGGRVLVGLGASLIIPSVLGMIPALYESRRRAIAFSGIAGAAALATLSPLPFGALVDAGGFRVPFVVLAVYFAFILLATKALPAVRIPASGLKLDPGGIALASAGIMLLLLGMSRLPTWGVITPTAASPFTVFGLSPSLPLAAAGAILLVALVAYERRIERMTGCALIPRSFLASPHVRSGLLAVFVPFFYLGAYLILLIPYLQLVGGYTATQAGLVSALSTVPMFLLAVLLPKIMPHTSSRLIIRIGFALLALAFLLMGLGVGGGANTTLLLIGVFLGGCGVGTVNSQANNAVASAVVGRDAQQSGGIQSGAQHRPGDGQRTRRHRAAACPFRSCDGGSRASLPARRRKHRRRRTGVVAGRQNHLRRHPHAARPHLRTARRPRHRAGARADQLYAVHVLPAGSYRPRMPIRHARLAGDGGSTPRSRGRFRRDDLVARVSLRCLAVLPCLKYAADFAFTRLVWPGEHVRGTSKLCGRGR